MLKLTKVELELITDNEQYLFIESSISNGLSSISKRYAKANNDKIYEYKIQKN